jgi:hypothetical protein
MYLKSHARKVVEFQNLSSETLKKKKIHTQRERERDARRVVLPCAVRPDNVRRVAVNEII